MTNSNGHFRNLEINELEFLSSRITAYSSQKNEMVSEEWREYLRVKHAENFSQERLNNFADPNYGLTYGFYGKKTNDKVTLAHHLYQGESLYQQLMEIKEPDVGNPPKKFALKNQSVSGNFLRQIYYTYRLLKHLNKAPSVILEIGGSYGLLAYIWKMLFPQSKVLIVDIPETILLQYYFLRNACPKLSLGHLSNPINKNEEKVTISDLPDVTLVECNSLNLLDIKTDVVLALASLQEMSAKVVDTYTGWMQKNIAEDGLFYMYSCYGMDPESYKSPTQIQIESRWRVVHLEQPTLVENDYHHLEIILQRSNDADPKWNQKKELLGEYYEAMRARDHEKMMYFSRLILE